MIVKDYPFGVPDYSYDTRNQRCGNRTERDAGPHGSEVAQSADYGSGPIFPNVCAVVSGDRTIADFGTDRLFIVSFYAQRLISLHTPRNSLRSSPTS